MVKLRTQNETLKERKHGKHWKHGKTWKTWKEEKRGRWKKKVEKIKSAQNETIISSFRFRFHFWNWKFSLLNTRMLWKNTLDPMVDWLIGWLVSSQTWNENGLLPVLMLVWDKQFQMTDDWLNPGFLGWEKNWLATNSECIHGNHLKEYVSLARWLIDFFGILQQRMCHDPFLLQNSKKINQSTSQTTWKIHRDKFFDILASSTSRKLLVTFFSLFNLEMILKWNFFLFSNIVTLVRRISVTLHTLMGFVGGKFSFQKRALKTAKSSNNFSPWALGWNFFLFAENSVHG